MSLASVTVKTKRHVYMVLSPRSLQYALGGISGLFQHSLDAVDLQLITDTGSDRETLIQAVTSLHPDPRHAWGVTSEDDLADVAASKFARFPHLRQFRSGHPCWRKITDPLLIAAPEEEIILLDPDVCFPNRFRFEETAAAGLKLMWQRPTCLFPREVVRQAMAQRIPLAHHVDIGVAHCRADVDLEWMDWLIGKLGGADLPRLMHVEAIVWAALAMRVGGSYLDPRLWVCWHRTQLKRLRRLLGASGADLLSEEPWPQMKCFHGGGEAKWVIPDLVLQQRVEGSRDIAEPGRILPFVELGRSRYEVDQTIKDLLQKTGYYRVFGAKHA